MENFKKIDGESIEDLGGYIREYYLKNPDIKIYVGTDSAQHGKYTKYATAISMLKPGKGVHVIYKKTSIKRVRDIFTRLWKETEHTLEVGEYVHNCLDGIYNNNNENKKIPILHLDLNKSPKYKSNIAHDVSIGYLRGYGFEVQSKSDSWCSSFCADMLVKN